MFQYGRVNGYLTIALVALGIIPLVIAFVTVPQMPDTVAMAFDTAGKATRYASRYQVFLVPAVSLLLSIATIITGRRSARANADSAAASELVYRRSLRNGIVMDVILLFATIYIIVTAFLGSGLRLPV